MREPGSPVGTQQGPSAPRYEILSNQPPALDSSKMFDIWANKARVQSDTACEESCHFHTHFRMSADGCSLCRPWMLFPVTDFEGLTSHYPLPSSPFCACDHILNYSTLRPLPSANLHWTLNPRGFLLARWESQGLERVRGTNSHQGRHVLECVHFPQ